MKQEYFNEIQSALRQQAGFCHVSDSMKQNIDKRLAENLKMEEKNMARFQGKKVAAAAVLATALTGTVCFAAGKATMMYSSTDSIHTQYGQLAREEEKLGIAVGAPEEFANGYRFTEFSVVNNNAGDDAGNIVGDAYQSLAVTYEKDGKTVFLDVEPQQGEEFGANEGTFEQGGITYCCNSMRNKIVPEDYVPTEEEERAIEEGTLNLATDGGDEISEDVYVSVCWNADGQDYSLSGFDVDLEDLKQMAAELGH